MSTSGDWCRYMRICCHGDRCSRCLFRNIDIPYMSTLLKLMHPFTRTIYLGTLSIINCLSLSRGAIELKATSIKTNPGFDDVIFIPRKAVEVFLVGI